MKLILRSMKSKIRSDRSWSNNFTKSKSWSGSLCVSGFVSMYAYSAWLANWYWSKSWFYSLIDSWKH